MTGGPLDVGPLARAVNSPHRRPDMQTPVGERPFRKFDNWHPTIRRSDQALARFLCLRGRLPNGPPVCPVDAQAATRTWPRPRPQPLSRPSRRTPSEWRGRSPSARNTGSQRHFRLSATQIVADPCLRRAGRVNSRKGYRHRDFDTRAGTMDLAVPKLRQGSLLPGMAVGAPAAGRKSPHPSRLPVLRRRGVSTWGWTTS